MKHLLALLLVLALVGCSSAPSEKAVQTAIAQTQVAMPTQAATVAPTSTPLPPAVAQPTATLKPRPTDTPRPTSTPKPQVKLEVGSYTSYRNLIGTLVFVGEILNNGDAPATGIQVAISLLDSSGNVLATGSSNLASLRVAPANGKYPFSIWVDKAPKEWKDIKIQVQGDPLDNNPLFPPYLDLKADKVTGQPPESSYGYYGLVGKITNVGQQTAKLVHIVAVAYDKDGKVIDVGDTYSKLDQIQPGTDAPFQLEFGNIKDAPARYETFVQGMANAPSASATPKSPTAVPTPVPTLSAGAKQLTKYTLRLDDLPTGFLLKQEEEITPEQAAQNDPDPAASLEEYRQQGRLFSAMVTYRKQASLTSMLMGPIEVSSQVIEYRDATGAKRGMTLVVDNLKSHGVKPLSAGKLGDQSAAFQYNYKDDLELVLFSVVIQRRNLVSIVNVMGLSGGTSADDAYKLAQTAAGRLE